MNSIELPESLVAQLRAYEGRLRKMETLAAVAGGAVGLLATFLLLFAFDRFIDTPRWARVILTLTGGALAAWFAHGWAHHWLWKRRGPRQLAKLLQRHFKTLGDRLQGVIELTETNQLPANISPGLMRAAIRQVAEESGRFDFTQAVPVRPARRWALAAIILAALTAAPFVFVPKAAFNALARFAAPWADVDRYTFASLNDLPKELVVAHGEPFEIACGLKADSAWKPDEATARLNRQEAQRAKFQDGRAVFRLTGQTQNGVLALRVGDAMRDITIRPMHRPEMKQLAAQVELPAYLGYPASNIALQGSTAEFLEGSKVRFVGKTSRTLKEAELTKADGSKIAEVQGESFVTPAALVTELGKEASFRWADLHGLTPTQPYSIKIATTQDTEPRVELQGLEQETAILPHEVLKVSLASTDDYGLKEAWLGWSVRTLGEKKHDLGKGEAARTAGEHTKKELTAATEFSPLWQKIPEDSVVEMAAYAVDYAPNRKPIESWKHTIYVLSPAKHAERVRERMDQVLKQLDERIRDEERQLEETTAIAQDKEKLPGERAGENIKKVEAGERGNSEMLQKLTDEMRSVMKDALRNKEVPESTVAEWKQLTEQLDDKANPSMQEASQSLQQAGQQPENREQQLAKAQQQQQQALEEMRKAAKQMNTANQNLYARNFYNRLRAAAAAEYKVSDGLKTLAKDTVGLKPEEIAEEQKQDFNQVAVKQDETTKDVDTIVNDMTGFLKRVPNEKYAGVHREMQEKKVVAELTELAGFVRANLGLKSVGRAKRWGEQLDAWAGMLQAESNSQGSGGGEVDPDLMELIIAMVRAAQAQDNIREQTLLLDGKKEKNPQHADDAKKLATQQYELRDSVDDLRENTKFDDVKPLLDGVETLMDEVASQLRGAKTNGEVVTTQSTVIELLVPPGNKNGKSESKMQQMLQQMMAQATRSRTGGGNSSKSSSNLEGERAEGAAGGSRANARQVEKAGGAGNAGEWPEEFRDQLQSYFQEIEAGVK